jgi:hydrogenase maturation protein HypF
MDVQRRLRVTVRGAVQGVGFRPFVYRLAGELGLSGWVRNTAQGVLLEVEGSPDAVEAFRLRLESERPPRSFIQSLEALELDPLGLAGFEILPSDASGARRALVLPDIATCPDCVREIFDPSDRRYRYPFTNCTNCGPRFTIIETLPYDRPGTSMKGFAMCPACRAEYADPADRRFHAQPNACPECGPQLALWDGTGRVSSRADAALTGAIDALRAGAILAVKGLGGFHLMTDARSESAVRELRRRKLREEKPLACMFPTMDAVRAVCEVSPAEARLLLSPEAPIVLLRRRDGGEGAPHASVAPGNPTLGVMLPYTPLHHLLMAGLGFPVVATSGNRSDEPICIDEGEALERLRGIADLFLVHDRPILRPADDSITRLCGGRELVLRRARGFAPLPVPLPGPAHAPAVLAVGAYLKNTIALGADGEAFTSQHIGDLETPQARAAFEASIRDLSRLFAIRPERVACDLHPDYPSTRHARESGLAVIAVQHHLAHALACMAENELEPPVLAVAWDGTGYGEDGTVWGGEFLRVDARGWERVAHLRTFRLPGGERAVREPRRSALGLLHALLGDAVWERTDLAPLRAFTVSERAVLCAMLAGGVNAPVTSSAGRLFDGVAAMLGLSEVTRFEGQAAMALEFAALSAATDAAYPFELTGERPASAAGEVGEAGAAAGAASAPRSPHMPRIVDWGPMLAGIAADIRAGVAPGVVARMFHNTLAEMIVTVARAIGLSRVVMSGGCFQNTLLTERAIERLRAGGFVPYWHQRVPPNDGGIALGQLAAAMRAIGDERAAGAAAMDATARDATATDATTTDATARE